MKPTIALILVLATACTSQPSKHDAAQQQDNAQRQAEAQQRATEIRQEAYNLGNEGNYHKAIAVWLDNETVFKEAGPDYETNMYGNLSFCYLFIKDFQKAEESARNALQIDGTPGWIKSNLAWALFLQGRNQEAYTIFWTLSHTLNEYEETYTKTVLGTLETLEQAGIIPPRIRACNSRTLARIRAHPGNGTGISRGNGTLL